MTLWQSCGLVFGYVVYAVAWFWGGRPERFGAGVLLISCLFASPANAWEVRGFYPGFIALECATLLVFGWLSFRSDRWWPMAVAAAAALISFGEILRLMNPTFSQYALVSAKIGLAYVVDLALLLGVWERWLAGDPPAAPAAWAKADQVTAARHNRRNGARRPEESPRGASGCAKG